MLIKFVVTLSILALVATAGSIPTKGPSFHVFLSQTVVIQGTTLKAGDYRVTVNGDKAAFQMDQESKEIPVKVETGDKKYSDNQVQYDESGKQPTVKQICVGGSKTKLLFN
jgi:hypothetical protein